MSIRKNLTLTPKQEEIYNLIKNYIENKGISPTVSELANLLQVKSLRTVTQFLESLEKKGLIKRARYQTRGIQLVEPEDSVSDTVTLPVIGAASCGGLNVFAQQVFDEFITLAQDFLNGIKKDKAVVIKAQGNSMLDAGIKDGDFVLTEVTQDVINGDKVVAVIDGMATIKKFTKTENAVILNPMSTDPQYSPIIMKEDFQIFGKVVETIKHPKNEEITYEPI